MGELSKRRPALYATATCCRGCLQKWRDVTKGRKLREDKKCYVLGVIERWLSQQAQMATGDNASPRSSENAPCSDEFIRHVIVT